MLPGFWLMAALPISALILVPIGEVFNMSTDLEDPVLAFGFATGFLISGYLWSRALLRRAGISTGRLAKLAAGTGFALSIIAVEVQPAVLDSLPELVGVQGITHLEFKVIFMIWTGIATGVTGLALGLGLKRWRLALKLLFSGFLTGSAVFLVVALFMDAVGFRVGVPRADGIPSMPVVTLLGIWLAALIGTGVFWLVLSRNEIVKETAEFPPPFEQNLPGLRNET